jgi:hypothetical protein
MAVEVRAAEPRWVSRIATEGGMPQFTHDPSDALSPTASLLAATLFERSGEVGMRMVVELYEVPESSGFSREARQIAQTKAYVHEVAHMISRLEWDVRAANIRLLKDGEQIDPRDFIIDFVEAAEEHPPISNYSAAYRDDEGEFFFPDSDGLDEEQRRQAIKDLEQAIGEELAECITAYLLGFTVAPDGEVSFDPFSDRPDVQEAVENYLNAKRIVLAS